MKQKLICIPLLFLITSVTKQTFAKNFADKSIVDSLKKELNKPNIHDTTYINLLSEIGEQASIFRISYWDTVLAPYKSDTV